MTPRPRWYMRQIKAMLRWRYRQPRWARIQERIRESYWSGPTLKRYAPKRLPLGEE